MTRLGVAFALRGLMGGRELRRPRVALHVFVGPTLDSREVRAIAPSSRVHPPAGRGDIGRIARAEAAVIAIIDASTHERPAPAPSEIARALARGARIFGAGGIGAFLAVDHVAYGMIGSGVVHTWAREGWLVGMDEAVATRVARVTPAERNAANLRHAIDRAVATGAIGRKAGQELLREYRRLPVFERALAAIPGRSAARLRRFVRRRAGSLDLGAADARRLLAELQDAYGVD